MAYHVRYALPAEAARNTSIESKIPTPNFQKLGPGWYRLAMKILFSWNLERWRLWFFTPCIFDMWDDNTKRVDWATRQNLKQQGAQLSAMLIDQHLHATRLAASWTQPPHCEDRSWAARFWEWEQFFFGGKNNIKIETCCEWHCFGWHFRKTKTLWFGTSADEIQSPVKHSSTYLFCSWDFWDFWDFWVP